MKQDTPFAARIERKRNDIRFLLFMFYFTNHNVSIVHLAMQCVPDNSHLVRTNHTAGTSSMSRPPQPQSPHLSSPFLASSHLAFPLPSFHPHHLILIALIAAPSSVDGRTRIALVALGGAGGTFASCADSNRVVMSSGSDLRGLDLLETRRNLLNPDVLDGACNLLNFSQLNSAQSIRNLRSSHKGAAGGGDGGAGG